MASTMELIDQLIDQRLRAVDSLQELVVEVEAAGGEWTAEDEQRASRMNEEIDSLRKRIDALEQLQKQGASMDEQRQKFEKIVRPDGQISPDSDEERMRNWIRALSPESDAWAPRSITFPLGQKVKDSVRARKMGDEFRDLSKGTATDGAELIPTGFLATLYEHMVENAAVRQTGALILTTDSGENITVPKTTTHGTAALVAEAGTVAEDDPQFANVTLNAYKYWQRIDVSRELVEDSAVDLLDYIARAAGRNVGLASGTHFVTGTGSGQPQGVANSPTAGKTGATGQTTTVIAEDLIDLYHSVVSGYRTRGVWLMNDLSAAIVRKIRDASGASAGTGNFMWQPGLQAGMPDRLLGKPVVTDPNVATMAANAYSIAFGDFSEYYIIRDVNGVRFDRSDDFLFGTDQVAFRVLIRTDGKQVVNGSGGAVKFYRNSAT